MLNWLNHVAIAVPDLTLAATQYERLGGVVSPPQDLPEHSVTVVFVKLPNTKIELLHPLGPSSPIAAFLEKNPKGGIHHICFEVAALENTMDALNEMGVTLLGDGQPKIGAHDKPVIFAHPKNFQGALVEFEQS
jgi:methylmalonyl-CoA/ethylmalonyl-CoA epimerase